MKAALAGLWVIVLWPVARAWRNVRHFWRFTVIAFTELASWGDE